MYTISHSLSSLRTRGCLKFGWLPEQGSLHFFIFPCRVELAQEKEKETGVKGRRQEWDRTNTKIYKGMFSQAGTHQPQKDGTVVFIADQGQKVPERPVSKEGLYSLSG